MFFERKKRRKSRLPKQPAVCLALKQKSDNIVVNRFPAAETAECPEFPSLDGRG
jgi:hypothetical protein